MISVSSPDSSQAFYLVNFDVQQSNGHNILRPGIVGLIELGGMVVKETTTKDLASGFVIDGIVECDQQSALNGGLRNESPEDLPQPGPWHLWGRHEGVKASASQIQAKQCL